MDDTIYNQIQKAPDRYRACPHCGFVGIMPRGNEGSCLILIILFLFLIIPGIIYLIWLTGKDGYRCPSCKTWKNVPLKSPVGFEIFQRAPKVKQDDILKALQIA